MDFQAASFTVASGSEYRSKISRNGFARQHVFAYDYTFTDAGALGGTLFIEGSNSDDALLGQDKDGGTDTTDAADWYPLGAINAAGSTVTSVAISAAVAAALHITVCAFKAVRLRFDCTAGGGTWVSRVSSRRA